MQMVVSYEAISGYPNGTFRGNKTISRAEFAKIMTNALSYLEKKYDMPLADETSAEATFKDLKAANWAYPFVNQLVSKYKIVSGYPDGTFRPNKTINRIELATVLAKTLKLIYSRYDMTLTVPSKEVALQDVKPKHWAMKDIQLLLSLKIMEAAKGKKKGQLLFNGNANVTRYDVAVSGAKLIGMSDAAIAALPASKLEALRGKAKPGAPVLSGVARAIAIPSKPQATIGAGYGNVYEHASGTNNWRDVDLSGTYSDKFSVWKLAGNYELTGKYGLNQMVYLVPLGGGITGGVVNESRYDLELNTIYPIVKFMGIDGKLLVGAKYINLSNPTAPTNFTGLNLGLVTGAKVLNRDLLIKAFYSLPLARAAVSPSVFGQPKELFDYQASLDSVLFSTPLLIGFAGETMTFSGGALRYYNTVYVSYFLF